MTHPFWTGKRVLVTGHTGFKGGWLCLWLQRLGARVCGYGLPPDTRPSLFDLARVGDGMDSLIGDIRDAAALESALARTRPAVVFHLAAQPLVRRSYREPQYTFSANVMGTVNLLEAVRKSDTVRVCQIITTDKCYENRESDTPYRETDALGGHDPYSGSKACAELAAAVWRRSFLAGKGISLATARAGNVIGGGDWSEDRIVPDFVRALEAGRPLGVRNARAIRPWQHVLEPLSGYLWLARRQWEAPGDFAEAWNFGPDERGVLTVGQLADRLVAHWGAGGWECRDETEAPHEAGILRLDISKARERLAWRPVLDPEDTVRMTAGWYRARGGGEARALCEGQIAEYELAARHAGLPWAEERSHAHA